MGRGGVCFYARELILSVVKWGKHSQLYLIRLLHRQLGKVAFLRQWQGQRKDELRSEGEATPRGMWEILSMMKKKVGRCKPKARANRKTKQKADNVTRQHPGNKTSLDICKALWIAEHRRAYWWEVSTDALRSLQIDGEGCLEVLVPCARAWPQVQKRWESGDCLPLS